MRAPSAAEAATIRARWANGDPLDDIRKEMRIGRNSWYVWAKCLALPERRPAHKAITWSAAKSATLKSMVEAGYSMREIAVEIGCSRHSISNYLNRLRQSELVPLPRTAKPQVDKVEAGTHTMRRCLGADCGRLFPSWGAGNRICSACKSTDAHVCSASSHALAGVSIRG